MAISVITGSDGIGKYLETADQNIIEIISGVESMNSLQAIPRLRGMDFLNTFIRTIEGVQGHTEGFKDYKVFASDDGSFSDAVSYKESYETWTFGRRGYTVKDKDFTHEMLDMAYEEGKDLSKIVADRMIAISRMYLNDYLPNVAYETLFEVPEEGGRYYGSPVGFLRNTVVDPDMLKVYAQGDEYLTRNHYRTISGDNVSANDIEDIVEFLSEYRDITDGNIVAVANRSTLYKLQNTLMYDANKDIFNRTGQPTQTICGTQFIINDFIPKNWVLFIAGEASHLITKLVSPKADRRGMAIVAEKGLTKLENVHDLVGSQFKILPEGYHLTGRHYGCFLYIGPKKGDHKPNPARYTFEAINEEVALLSAHAYQLRSNWYRGLR